MYDRISKGMSYSQVRDIIGVTGEELSCSEFAGTTTIMYSWTNSNGSNMNAIFHNGRLTTKAQFVSLLLGKTTSNNIMSVNILTYPNDTTMSVTTMSLQ